MTDVEGVARTRWPEDYFDDDVVAAAVSMGDAVMEIVAVVGLVTGAVKSRDSDVPQIQKELAYSVAVVVSILSNFQREVGVTIYEMFDAMYFLYHWKT